MKSFQIRTAVPDDAPEIVPLLAQLGYGCTDEAVRSNAEEISSSSADALIVAEDGGELVGLAHMHTARMIHKPMPVARVTALVVRADRRRDGVGRALLESLEELAAQAECSVVEMTSGIHRAAAHAFYESLGYREKSRGFVKELRRGASI